MAGEAVYVYDRVKASQAKVESDGNTMTTGIDVDHSKAKGK